MSFQAYLDAIRAKTGQSADELAAMAGAKGLARPADVVAWLKTVHGLGHGHAMAVVAVMRRSGQPARSADERVAGYFSGSKARWRSAYEQLFEAAKAFGPDVGVSPGATYLSLTRGGKKFAIIQAGGERMDVGIKLRGAAAEGRFEPAGSWNAMVTHRVRVANAAQLDGELLDWLRRAYAAA